ncbi:MAG: hypothetical protein GF364_19435 [Candidatus Lokiarchaeota archaeon]|nr:hypothetical protein [Candidatus Lokiarchaeota archaeon]
MQRRIANIEEILERFTKTNIHRQDLYYYKPDDNTINRKRAEIDYELKDFKTLKSDFESLLGGSKYCILVSKKEGFYNVNDVNPRLYYSAINRFRGPSNLKYCENKQPTTLKQLENYIPHRFEESGDIWRLLFALGEQSYAKTEIMLAFVFGLFGGDLSTLPGFEVDENIAMIGQDKELFNAINRKIIASGVFNDTEQDIMISCLDQARSFASENAFRIICLPEEADEDYHNPKMTIRPIWSHKIFDLYIRSKFFGVNDVNILKQPLTVIPFVPINETDLIREQLGQPERQEFGDFSVAYAIFKVDDNYSELHDNLNLLKELMFQFSYSFDNMTLPTIRLSISQNNH